MATDTSNAPTTKTSPQSSRSKDHNHHDRLSTSSLSFEKKNTNLLPIPKRYRIQKRPIPHAPVASPYAGANVPKVVYVGTNTPFMSAVKRVQKLLRLAERRATAPLLDEKSKKRLLVAAKAGEGERERLLLASQEKLKEEKVFVKATGRAMEKALGVGKWFQERTEAYEVSVRTGSVCVVDDIVPPDDEPDADARDDQTQLGGDRENPDAVMDGIEDGKKEDTLSESKNQRRRRRKRERVQKQRREVAPDDDDDDNDGELPESRTRWINMVEVAINLK